MEIDWYKVLHLITKANSARRFRIKSSKMSPLQVIMGLWEDWLYDSLFLEFNDRIKGIWVRKDITR